MKRKYILTVAFLMIGLCAVRGQNITDTIEIKEVKVLAKRKVEEAGLKITRPDSMARVSSITTSLSDLISSYSPVFIKSYGRGSEATASFRGTAATHTQVIWNGMNLNSPMRGIADLSLFPVFFTDDVFLLHGGSSLTEGSGALGGSILMNTQPDWSSDFNTAGIFERGSFNSNRAFLKTLLGKGRIRSNTRLFFDGSENNFPFYNYGVIPHRNDTLENAAYKKMGILQEFYYRSYSNTISALRFWFQQSDRDLPQLMSYEGSSREEYQKDNQLRIQYEWKKYTDVLNYRFFSGLTTNNLKYYRATPAFNFINEDSRSRETGFLNQLKIFRKFDEKNYATASIDINVYKVSILDQIKGEGYDQNRLETSLLVNWHMKPSEMFTTFVLMRSENYDSQVVPLIPAVGIEWQPFIAAPLVLRMNGARNYHKPTLNDLYWLPGGNPDLLPEDGFTGDLSISFQREREPFFIQCEVTGFISKIENWIIWQPASNGAYFWEADNVKNVVSCGTELKFLVKNSWNRIQFISGGNYSFTSTINQDGVNSVDESRGKQLIYIPKNKGNIYTTATLKQLTLKYDLEYIGKRYTKSSNEESPYERVLNPYWLSKVSVDKWFIINQFRMNLKFTVENLFNEDYQSVLWRPMPGRYYTFSVGFSFQK